MLFHVSYDLFPKSQALKEGLGTQEGCLRRVHVDTLSNESRSRLAMIRPTTDKS
jgi:hypothetical protein